MAKFRKKPVEVQAEQFFTYHDAPRLVGWIRVNGGKATYRQLEGKGVEILIETQEGLMCAEVSDWIIKEPFPSDDRRFYPCKPDIFKKTYEPA